MLSRIQRKLIALGAWKAPSVRGKRCIVMYHGIDRHERMDLNVRFFSATHFEEHIAFFKQRYNVIPLAHFMNGEGLRNDRLNVAITFDDGYRNNLTYALPILERHACPATFFITGLNTVGEEILWADLLDICGPRITDASITFQGTVFERGPNGRFPQLRQAIKEQGFLGTSAFTELKEILLSRSGVELNDPDLQDHFRLLTDDEIRAVGRSRYVQVGSHGMFHNNLGVVPFAQAVAELRASKAYLEGLIQQPVDSIGYPDGSYSEQVAAAAYDMGFAYQCAVDYRHATDAQRSYLHDRIGLYPPLSRNTMHHGIATFSR